MVVVPKIFYGLKKGKVTPKTWQPQHCSILPSRDGDAKPDVPMPLRSWRRDSIRIWGLCPTAGPHLHPRFQRHAAQVGSPPQVSDADLIPSPINPFGHLSPTPTLSRRHWLAPRSQPSALLRICFGNNTTALCSQLKCIAKKKDLRKKKPSSNMQGPGSYKQDFFRVPGSE